MVKRVGSDKAILLLASNDKCAWEVAYTRYAEGIRCVSSEKDTPEQPGLLELDRWWREELPLNIRSRGDSPYVTKAELERIALWKLRRGKDRPNLLNNVRSNSEDKVRASSSAALSHLPAGGKCNAQMSRFDPRAAVQLMAAGKGDLKLKGVGPATASAVLAAYCGACPFMADEVIDAVMGTGQRKYTIGEYLQVQQALSEKALELGGDPWDAERVGKALWACAMVSRYNLSEKSIDADDSSNSPDQEGNDEGVEWRDASNTASDASSKGQTSIRSGEGSSSRGRKRARDVAHGDVGSGGDGGADLKRGLQAEGIPRASGKGAKTSRG